MPGHPVTLEFLGIVLIVLAVLASRRCGWDPKPGHGLLRAAAVLFALAVAVRALSVLGADIGPYVVFAGLLASAGALTLVLGVLAFQRDGERR